MSLFVLLDGCFSLAPNGGPCAHLDRLLTLRFEGDEPATPPSPPPRPAPELAVVLVLDATGETVRWRAPLREGVDGFLPEDVACDLLTSTMECAIGAPRQPCHAAVSDWSVTLDFGPEWPVNDLHFADVEAGGGGDDVCPWEGFCVAVDVGYRWMP